MEIKPPANNLYTAISRIIPATSQNNLSNNTIPPDWKVAQLIQAVITKISEQHLFLDIQGVKANTPRTSISDLQVGDILKLQIEQLKPMPQFRVISLQKNLDSHLISQAIKKIASQQTSLTPLLKNISFIATRPALRPAPLSVDVNAAVRHIYKQLPAPFNLKTATQIKSQLQNSGIFIENKIKNQVFSSLQNMQTKTVSNLKSELNLDLGAQLHRLANLIRTQLTPAKNPEPLNINSPQNTTKQINNAPENKAVSQQSNRTTEEQASLQNINQREQAMQTFLRQVESSLTHMQQTQLQNLNESQAGRPLWLMELPIKDGQDIDLFELHITEEENSQSEGETKKIWNVTLQFNLTGLGKIKAHIKMQNELISAQFFSEKPETLALFQKNFDFLRSRLSYNGLNVGNIECAHAKLAEDTTPFNSTQLDEQI